MGVFLTLLRTIEFDRVNVHMINFFRVLKSGDNVRLRVIIEQDDLGYAVAEVPSFRR